MDCLFCQIANHQKESEIVYEDELMIVFKDIRPKAPVHLLIVPKKHIQSINELTQEDGALISQMFFLAKDLARQNKVDRTGYRLIFNVGRGSGQLIDHLHLHLLGGGDLTNG